MSTVEKSIRLYAWKTNYQTFQVVQGEANSRKFNIQLFSTTTPVDLTNCEVMFYAVKPDSTKVYVECEIIDAENGLASVTLTDQMCVVDGTVDCWVQVIGEGGTDLRFEGMNIEVSPCLMTMSIESSDDMRAFLQQSAKLAAFQELLENTPYTTVESEGEFELPVHTINDSKISDDSTWSSKKIIDAIYPVGAIYMSVNSTNPSTLLGGTWVAWGAGRVPVGVGTGKDSNETSKSFTNAEETAGEYTHKLTISEMPDHVHSVDALSLKKSGESSAQRGSGTFAFSGLVNTTSTDGMGDGNSHNNIQPYITCYMWKRTA